MMFGSKKILVVCLSLLLVAAIGTTHVWFLNRGVLFAVFQMSRLPSGARPRWVKPSSGYKAVQNNKAVLISEMDADWLAILNRMEISSFDGELIRISARSRFANNFQYDRSIASKLLQQF